MRRILACLALLVVGCGSDDGATQPAPGDGGPGGDSAAGGHAGAAGAGAQAGAAGAGGAAAGAAGSSGAGGGGPIITHPDNILNNGDFEAGLMCWGNWVWSNTGQDYKGDYDFLLSTDAHGGTYSVEINCTGADCLKAAINSDLIYTPPNQAYKLTLWTKCPSGKQAAVYIPALAGGDFFQNVTCSDQWAENQFSFSAAATGKLHVYVYNRDTAYLRIDDMVLTYADGTVPVQTTQYPGVRNVGLSGSAITVDGTPYLALGFFDVPFEELEQVASLHANTVTGLGGNTSPGCFNTAQQNYADHAHELGLGLVPDSTTSARLDNGPVFGSIMDKFAPHQANVAWLLVDEPDQADVAWYSITGPNLVAEYSAAKAKTSLPILADMQRASWSSATEVSPYVLLPYTDHPERLEYHRT